MSIDDVLSEVRTMASKVDGLSAEVEAIKQRERDRIEEEEAMSEAESYTRKGRSRSRRSRTPSRSRTPPRRTGHPRRRRAPSSSNSPEAKRSPSPARKRSRSPTTSTSKAKKTRAFPYSWADIDPDTKADYSANVHFSDEEDGIDSSQLVEVSEQTHQLLTTSCTRSVPNEVRKRTRSRFKLPKVVATRTPRLDHVMRSLVPQTAKSADKELARIQTFVLDSLAPITSLLESWRDCSKEEVRDASLAAAELIGNANARISRLRREKLVASMNKDLTPLVKEDGEFTAAAPDLFRADFTKRAKDHLDQVKSLKAVAFPSRQYSGGDHRDGQYRRPNFRKGNPSGRGSARGRGGGPNHSSFKGIGERQSR
jgi:hypothetical protein